MFRWFGIPWLVRRWAFRSGVRSDNRVEYFLAMVVIGRAAYLRRSAKIRGVYGNETGWRVLAGFFYAKDLLAKLTVKEVDVLTTETLKAGERVQITSIPPAGRRRRRARAS